MPFESASSGHESPSPRRGWLSFERAVILFPALAALPGIGVAAVLLWTSDVSATIRWGTIAGLLLATAAVVGVLRERLIRPVQTLSNMLAALRDRDYSMRVQVDAPQDAFGLLASEVNRLGRRLQEQRLEVLEATALLRRVMEEIDVAVFAFDERNRLRLLNQAAEELIGRSAERARGSTAEELGLKELTEGESPRVADLSFPGRASRWEVRRTTFRQDGVQHRLVVLSDLSRVLREEERKAWRRLVRVLSHEINNSLAPIRSIAESLRSLLEREGGHEGPGPAPAPEEDGGGGTEVWPEVSHGLDVIASRSDALSRFMSSYARLARLPEPDLAPLDVGACVRRVVGLETRVEVMLVGGEPTELLADGDQLEQVLINLLDNAVDAVRETGGDVRVGWEVQPGEVEIRVEDEGPGLPETENLFVPFFSTKHGGSGIGLALSRQIAEEHGGALTLENREEGPGSVARLRLPRKPPDTAEGAAGERGG